MTAENDIREMAGESLYNTCQQLVQDSGVRSFLETVRDSLLIQDKYAKILETPLEEFLLAVQATRKQDWNYILDLPYSLTLALEDPSRENGLSKGEEICTAVVCQVGCTGADLIPLTPVIKGFWRMGGRQAIMERLGSSRSLPHDSKQALAERIVDAMNSSPFLRPWLPQGGAVAAVTRTLHPAEDPDTWM